MSSVITASDAVQIDLDSVSHTLARNSGGYITSDTVVYAGRTYVQTYTLDSNNNVVKISNWVRQP